MADQADGDIGKASPIGRVIDSKNIVADGKAAQLVVSRGNVYSASVVFADGPAVALGAGSWPQVHSLITQYLAQHSPGQVYEPQVEGAEGKADDEWKVNRNTILGKDFPLQSVGPEVDPSTQPLLNGEYLLGPSVGAGAMGKVFKAKQLTTGQTCAIKVVYLPMETPPTGDPQDEEPKLLSSMIHRNIVGYIRHWKGICTPDDPVFALVKLPTHEVDKPLRLLFIVMEYCTMSLEDLITRRPIPLWAAVSFVNQILDGIAYAHSQNVIHRDIKPTNIFIQVTNSTLFDTHPTQAFRSTVVKLGDFGVGRVLGHNSLASTVTGTLAYVPVDVVSQQGYGHNVDIYSLGVVLMQMITGMPSGYFAQHVYRIRDVAKTDAIGLVKEVIHPDKQEEAARQIEQDPLLGFQLAHTSHRLPDFIKTQIPQLCLRGLIASMVAEDARERPQAEVLLRHPILAYFRHIVGRNRNIPLPMDLSDNPETVLGAVAGVLCRASGRPLFRASLDHLAALLDPHARQVSERVKILGRSDGIDIVVDQCRLNSNNPGAEALEDWMRGLKIIELALKGAGPQAADRIRDKLAKLNFRSLIAHTKSNNLQHKIQLLTVASYTIENDSTWWHHWKSDLEASASGLLQNTGPGSTLDSQALAGFLPHLAPVQPSLYASYLALGRREVLRACLHVRPRDRPAFAAETVGFLLGLLPDLLLDPQHHLHDISRVVRGLVIYSLSTSDALTWASLRNVCLHSPLTALLGPDFREPTQWMYHCPGCWPKSSNSGCCAQCAVRCHVGHPGLAVIWKNDGFICDCLKLPSSCKCSTPAAAATGLQVLADNPATLLVTIDAAPGIAVAQQGGSSIVTATADHSVYTATLNPIASLPKSQGTGEEEWTEAYFEIDFLHGGPSNSFALGVCNLNPAPEEGLKQARCSLECSTGFLSTRSASNQERKFLYSAPGGTGVNYGCGISNKGRVYFTRDGVMCPVLSNFQFDTSRDQKLFAYFRVEGRETSVAVNFGTTAFRFFSALRNLQFPTSLPPLILHQLHASYELLAQVDGAVEGQTKVELQALLRRLTDSAQPEHGYTD